MASMAPKITITPSRTSSEGYWTGSYNAGDGWQGVQAQLAIGSGGFWGLGLGQSIQKHLYLPEPANDFVFAVILILDVKNGVVTLGIKGLTECLDLLEGLEADRAEAVGGALNGLVVHNYGHVVAAEVNVVFKNVTARVKRRLERFYCIFGNEILDTSMCGDLDILSCCVFPSDSHFYFSFRVAIFKNLW